MTTISNHNLEKHQSDQDRNGKPKPMDRNAKQSAFGCRVSTNTRNPQSGAIPNCQYIYSSQGFGRIGH
jgi:hypothetical protein